MPSNGYKFFTTDTLKEIIFIRIIQKIKTL